MEILMVIAIIFIILAYNNKKDDEKDNIKEESTVEPKQDLDVVEEAEQETTQETEDLLLGKETNKTG